LDDELLRLRLVLLVFLLGQVVLGVFLWRIQVAQSDRYEIDQARQSIRRVRLPGVRGDVLDRHGEVLADNRPSHGVALYLEELRKPGGWKKTIDHVEEVIARLEPIIGRPAEVGREAIWTHIRRRLPMPLVVWRELSDPELARLAEAGLSIPGVELYTQPVRRYPRRDLAAHVLGYVGRADPPDEPEEPFDYYLPEMAGRAGIERSMDAALRGEAGGQLLRVDVSGYRRHDVGTRPARRGTDLMLALDARIQQLAERVLADVSGSAVVIDPNNGDVLALASSPGYDLNQFIPGISSANWRALNDDPETPLLNRAVAGMYPPGSTFKMITALAALVNDRATVREVHHCPGYFQLGRATFRCWHRAGHGPVNLEQAIEGSCNVYFFHVGLQAGVDAIYHMSTAFGLGSRTGIELFAEQPGLVPNPAWKRATQDDGWRDGDTCNVSIGQGALLVTPLQMALFTATLANGGTLFAPRLILGERGDEDTAFRERPPRVANQFDWDHAFIETIRLGMKDVVMSPRGSGRAAAVPGLVVAGKTGTAEFGRKEERRRHAWMIAFAPYDRPTVAVALLVDEGVSGGETAAPRMRQLLQGIFQGEAAVPMLPDGVPVGIPGRAG
jgi:penicillin-binding protein 2